MGFFLRWISWKPAFHVFLERVISHFRLNIISEIAFSCSIQMIFFILYNYSVLQTLTVYALCTMQTFLTPFHRQKYLLWCDLVNTRQFVLRIWTALNFTKSSKFIKLLINLLNKTWKKYLFPWNFLILLNSSSL